MPGISPGQLQSQLVDDNGFVRKEWYNVWQQISSTIQQTSTNTITIISNESSTLFDNSVTPVDPNAILASAGVPCAEFIPVPGHADALFLDGDIVPYPQHNDALMAWDTAAMPTPWTPYVATVTPSGAMTYTPVSQDSAYSPWGQSCNHRINLVGTIGGTPDVSISLSLPLTAYGMQSITGYAIIGSNNVPVLGSISGSTVSIQRYDGAAFSLGSITIVLTGTWQTLQ